MTNREIGRTLDRIADLLQIKDENPFKIAAYRKAANSIYHLDEDLHVYYQHDRIGSIPGIGKAVKNLIEELIEKGSSEYYQRLVQDIPEGVLDFLRIPGLGHKTTAVLPAPPVKVVLLAKDDDDWVNSRYAAGEFMYHARSWNDRSGNGYNAENYNDDNDLQPIWRKSDDTMIFQSGNKKKQYLTIKSGAECTNNFMVFVSAQPSEDHERDAVSNDPGNTLGTGGQKYLLYPTQKGTEAGMGISLGKNGVTVYEHGTSYMPAKARYDANLSDYHIIAVKYFQDTAGTVNPTPSIYVNGEHKTTGLPSNRAVVYSPLKIGGDRATDDQPVWGYYRGNLRAVVIYDSPVLDDANIKAVSQFLYDNYR
jgi:hypothetical protein